MKMSDRNATVWRTISKGLMCGLFVILLIAQGPGAVSAKEKPFPPVNPLSGNAESITEGQRLYFKWCVQCHGPKGNGVARFGKYAANLTKYWRGWNEFMLVVLNGRTKKRMPPWGGVLEEEEIQEIGAFLETLAVEGARWRDN